MTPLDSPAGTRADPLEKARVGQRAITERLVIGALREQDAARRAAEASERAAFLARASRVLSATLDETATRDAVRHMSLPRPGTWCIVDVVESGGAVLRLEVVHPDPARQALARELEDRWPSDSGQAVDADSVLRKRLTTVDQDSGAAVMLAAHGEGNFRILRAIGFGSLLVVPLIVRARVQGAITFVSAPGDPPFTADETALAVDLAARCAVALDNARLYRESEALRQLAESGNQSKAEFLANMSHELRTPLNAIGGFTDLIEMEIEGPVTAAQRVALGRIKANQQHLLTLITAVLDFVRVEGSRIQYRYGEVHMSQALADVVEMLTGMAREKGIIIATRCETADPVAWADPDRVRQVLLNLVMNAVKYTPAQGARIALTCAARGDTVIAEVADTGPGIPATKLESIFAPFVQLAAGRTDRRGGVGLGLAISRDLARAMGGDLRAESTVGVGSRFTLTLPIARPESK